MIAPFIPPEHHGHPAPSPSLDPEEITVPGDPPGQEHGFYHADASLHQRFRHSFWKDRRIATYAALGQCAPASKRLERFEHCGTDAWILRSKTDHNRYRIRVNACKDKFCEACSVERRRLVARNVVRNLPDRRLVFVTLTLKSSATPLGQQLTRITQCFHRLRNRTKLRPHFSGGLYFLEVTRNQETDLWHPHLHAIVDSPFIPHAVLKSSWHAITGDSFVVDVREVRNPSMVAGYITKYAAKSVNASVWTDQERLIDAIEALNGKRTFSTFGDWKGWDLSEKPEDSEGWISIGSLAEILRGARNGDGISMDIIRHVQDRWSAPEEEIDSS